MSPCRQAVSDSTNDLQAHDVVSLVDIIIAEDAATRNQSLTEYCNNLPPKKRFDLLVEQCDQLDKFRRNSSNLYHVVRALFFLYAIHRFHLPKCCRDNNNNSSMPETGKIPYEGYKAIMDRQFENAIDIFLSDMKTHASVAIASALAVAYYEAGFQTLANQVKLSVENHDGNQWMFRVSSPAHAEIVDHIQIHKEMLIFSNDQGTTNGRRVLMEQTPVRMDLSHCAWSDIFFLGMDFPQGARVLNVSVDLSVHGRDDGTSPPIETYLQVTDEPVLRLTSIDLRSTVTLTNIDEVFDFAKDYLGLLRAGIIASGIVPPGLEGCNAPLSKLFSKTIGKGMGLHLTTKVNDIPKGSRLAVSTNLLGMRATGQTMNLTGELTEEECRLVAARAILGEWLGGSGGGWQDSGGVWPGIKLIQGVEPKENDPEHGKSHGRLLPIHRQLSNLEAPETLEEALEKSLVLVHGGMAQNVGPVLEMVTEKYLLREADEWVARHDALDILDEILAAFKASDTNKLAELTTRNFFGPLQTIIPAASNLYTETLIERTREHFGDDFWGFWMLGGCSGGGMGFIFCPHAKAEALNVMQDIMLKTKREMQHALPFAMDPVVFDYSINRYGTMASWCNTDVPTFSNTSESNGGTTMNGESLDDILKDLGFDEEEHESIRISYKTGAIGLSQNRLPIDTTLSNVEPQDVIMASEVITQDMRLCGEKELANGSVGIVTLAAGVGSRWTQGAGCVKALHPFSKLGGRHRSFLEVHLAKSRRVSEMAGGTTIPHVITTSYMTDGPIQSYLDRVDNHGYNGPIYRSRGTTVGIRLIPTTRDLRFAWEETQQQKLDKNAQKVRESGQGALMNWAQETGEASDYRDNLPLQCLHPVGHYYEIPNLLLNGTLHEMIQERPRLKYLMLHNIDTVGANVDAGLLGLFINRESTLGYEVIPRQIHDVGGGLARINGMPRLVEGMALPREEDEFEFTYYNSMTTWIDIDKLLQKFGLGRDDVGHPEKVVDALHSFSHRLPTYVTLKDVKKRWGNGQEDVFPTAQFEKLWGDMSSLDDIECDFFVVPRERGAQLKDPAQLDGWLRDGSAAHLETLCHWDD